MSLQSQGEPERHLPGHRRLRRPARQAKSVVKNMKSGGARGRVLPLLNGMETPPFPGGELDMKG